MKHLVLILLASGFAVSASAEELPGVVQPERIVQPLPEPADQQADNKEAIRVGDWDVKVSGSVTVDIGSGSARKPPR